MPTGKSILRSGEPVNEEGRTWIFATNLTKHLSGNLQLRFIPNNRHEKSLGLIRLETSGGRTFLWIVENVSYQRFSELGEDLGWRHHDEGKGRFSFCNYSETT